LEEGEVFVAATYSTGHILSLSKMIKTTKKGEKKVKPGSAEYTLSCYGLKVQKFKGMGQKAPKGMRPKVPDVIQDFLKIGELNLQKQFDPPYLISSKDSEISKTISRILQIDKVYQWISTINQKAKQKKAFIEYHKDNLQKKELELEQLKPLDEIEPMLLEYEKRAREEVVLGKEIVQLGAAMVKADTLDGKVIRKGRQLKKLTSLMDERQGMEDSYIELFHDFRTLGEYIKIEEFLLRVDYQELFKTRLAWEQRGKDLQQLQEDIQVIGDFLEIDAKVKKDQEKT
jgi:hypothetical protein